MTMKGLTEQLSRIHSRLLIANSRSTFETAAHFNGGETASLTLPAAMPAHSLVYLGPDLVLARFTFKGILGECFIDCYWTGVQVMGVALRNDRPHRRCSGLLASLRTP